MLIRKLLKVGGLALAVSAGSVVGIALSADEPAKPLIKQLVKADVSGVEGKELLVFEVTAPPGYTFPLHTHPGEEFAYTLEGTLTTTSTGEVRGPGQSAFYKRGDIGGSVVGDTPAKFLAIFVVDKGKPLTELVK